MPNENSMYHCDDSVRPRIFHDRLIASAVFGARLLFECGMIFILGLMFVPVPGFRMSA